MAQSPAILDEKKSYGRQCQCHRKLLFKVKQLFGIGLENLEFVGRLHSLAPLSSSPAHA